jgi:CRP-like cAMP-binding protein
MEQLKANSFSAHTVAELIDKTTWANDFCWKDIVLLGDYFTAYEAQPGEMIFYEGAMADYMGLIVSGVIQISKTGADNQAQPLAQLKKSQTFGEQSLIDGSPRSGHAKALCKTNFVAVTRRQLMDMAEKEPSLAFRVLWKLAENVSHRLRHTSYQLLDSQNPQA